MSVDSKPFKIRGHQGDYNSFIKDRPILVIDDEVDNGSVDTGEQKLDEKGEFDPEYDPKTINRLIRTLSHVHSNLKSLMMAVLFPYLNY